MQAYSQIMHDAVVLKGYVIRVLHLVLSWLAPSVVVGLFLLVLWRFTTAATR